MSFNLEKLLQTPLHLKELPSPQEIKEFSFTLPSLKTRYSTNQNKSLLKAFSDRMQRFNSLFILWKGLLNLYYQPSCKNQTEAPYFLLKEILLIFYQSRYIYHITTIELSPYVLNLSGMALNYSLYKETILLSKLFNWIQLVSNENNMVNQKEFKTEGFGIEEWEKKGLGEIKSGLFMLLTRRFKAFKGLKQEIGENEWGLVENMRILLKKTKKNSFLEFYPLYFTLFTSKTPDLNEKIQDFFDLLLINKENHLLVFSFINDLAKILLDSSNLPETPYFLINYLPYYILTLSHSNSFSIQAENPLSTTFHNLFLLLSKTSLNPSPYLKLFILNDSNTMKKALDFDQIQINQLIKEIIPTSYFNLVQSFFLLKDVNNLIIKEGSSFENPNITHSNLLIVIEALKKVHPAFQGVSYYKDSLNFLLQELENKAFLIKIYNELESLKGNCLIKLLEASKTLDFIEKTVGVKEKGMKYSLEGFSIVEIAPELLKLQNALISMLIPFEKQNPLVLSNLFYSLLAKILSSIENPSFGGVFSIGEEYFGVLQGDYEGGGINEVELQIKRQIPFLLFISGNLLCNKDLKPIGVYLVNSFIKLMNFSRKIPILLGNSTLVSPLALISKVLKNSLSEKEIPLINNTFFFTETGCFNYEAFLRLLGGCLNELYEKSLSEGDRLLESYLNLYYQVYLKGNRLEISNIIDWHESFLNRFVETKNKGFFKAGIRETMKIMLKTCKKVNYKGKEEFLSLFLCLNNLYNKQAFCSFSFVKRIGLSLGFLEVSEFLLIELQREKADNIEEITVLIRKIYVLSFKTVLSNDNSNEEMPVYNEISYLELLLSILKALYMKLKPELTHLIPITLCKSPKKTLKLIIIAFSLIIKQIILQIELNCKKAENFDKNTIKSAFSFYSACFSFINDLNPLFSLIIDQNDIDIPLEHSEFSLKYLTQSKYPNILLQNPYNLIKTLLKQLITLSALLKAFDIPKKAILSLQIAFLIISTGNNLKISINKGDIHKLLGDLLLQGRISFVLMGLRDQYKEIGYISSVEIIDERVKRSFLASFTEVSGFIKGFNKETKENRVLSKDFKQTGFFITMNYRLFELEKVFPLKKPCFFDLIDIINEIQRKYKNKPTLQLLILRTKALIFLCEELSFHKGLQALAFTLLNEQVLSQMLKGVLKLEEGDILKGGISILGLKALCNAKGYWRSMDSEISFEDKSLFIKNIIDKGVISNDFFVLQSLLSKAMSLMLRILNHNIEAFSFSRYFEGVFLQIEFKSLKILEFFRLIEFSKGLFNSNNNNKEINEDLQGINKEINMDIEIETPFIFIEKHKKEGLNIKDLLQALLESPEAKELDRVFFRRKRRSSAARIGLNEIRRLCESIFIQYNENLKQEITIFISRAFYEIFGDFSKANPYEILMIRSPLLVLERGKQAILPLFIIQDNVLASLKNPIFCSLFRDSLMDIPISKSCLLKRHFLYRDHYWEGPMLVFFSSCFDKYLFLSKEPNLECIIPVLNLKVLLFIIIEETLVFDKSIAREFLSLYYRFSSIISIIFTNLHLNKPNFLSFLQSVVSKVPLTCSCSEKDLSKGFLKGKDLSEGFLGRNSPKKRFIKEKPFIWVSAKREFWLLFDFFNKTYDFKLFLKLFDLKTSETPLSPIQKAQSPCPIDSIKKGFSLYNPSINCINPGIKAVIKGSPIIFLRFLNQNNEKTLILGRFNPENERFFLYRLDKQHRLNFLKDYIVDFQRTISLNERDLKEKGSSPKDWWEKRKKWDKRIEATLKAIEEGFDFFLYLMLGDITDPLLSNQLIEETSLIIQYIIDNLPLDLLNFSIIKQEIANLTELFRLMLSLQFFTSISEIKLKLEMEEIKLYFILLQLIPSLVFYNIIPLITQSKSRLKRTSSPLISRKPVILLLDENFQGIPLEYLPLFLSNNQFFYRIPSFTYLNQIQSGNFPLKPSHMGQMEEFPLKSFEKLDLNRLFYVLNPQGDLIETQRSFEAFLKGFKGISGVSPTKELMIKVLKTKDFYLYLGHGAGETFFNEKEVRGIKEIRPAVLLIGCSTNKMVWDGVLEEKGIGLEYLMAKSRLVMGSLWDITDKDTDIMTKKLLELLKKSKGSGIELTEALSIARRSCRLKFLNGAAFICYGIPGLYNNQEG